MSSRAPPHCKQFKQLEQSAVTIQDRTWGAVNLCKVPALSTPAVDVNSGRVGTEARIMGFFMINTWMNKTNSLIKVYQYWITPRNYDPEVTTDTFLQDDFYTRHGLGFDDDGPWLPNLGSYLYDDPVNSKKFLVLKKKTFMLAPGAGVSGAAARPQMNKIDGFKSQKMFIKLDRKFTYGMGGEGGDGETPNLPIQPPVYWVTFHVAMSEPFGTDPGSSGVTRESHIVTYFRDGESGM